MMGAGKSSVARVIKNILDEDFELIDSDSQIEKNTDTSIHQILMNLCTNSSYAMQENGGILEVNLLDVDLDSKFTGQHSGVKPGKFIKLTVSDTGCGMSPEVSGRIFDPFFTTKDKERGTGLGLALAYNIVEAHGGKIRVESPPAKGISRGTRFILELPRSRQLIDDNWSI